MDLPTNNQPAKTREIIKIPNNIQERLALIEDSNTSEKVLLKCLQTDNETVLLTVLNSPNVTPGIIGILARKVNQNVKRAVAESEKTPIEILVSLKDQFPTEVGSNPTYLNLIDENSESIENLLDLPPDLLRNVEISEAQFGNLYNALIQNVLASEEILEDWSELDENDEEIDQEIDENYLKLVSLVNNPQFPQSLKDQISAEINKIISLQESDHLDYDEDYLSINKIDLLITMKGSDQSSDPADFSNQIISSSHLHTLSDSAMICLVGNPNLSNVLLSHIFSVSDNPGLVDVYISAVGKDNAAKFLPALIKMRNNLEKDIAPQSLDSEFLDKMRRSMQNITDSKLQALRNESK